MAQNDAKKEQNYPGKKRTTFIHRRTTNLEHGLSKLITQPILCTFTASKFITGKDWEKE